MVLLSSIECYDDHEWCLIRFISCMSAGLPYNFEQLFVCCDPSIRRADPKYTCNMVSNDSEYSYKRACFVS